MKPQGTAMLLLPSIPHPLPAQSGKEITEQQDDSCCCFKVCLLYQRLKEISQLVTWWRESNAPPPTHSPFSIPASFHCVPPSPTQEKRVLWLFPFQLSWVQVVTRFILRVLLPSSQADSKERQCKRILCCTFTLKWESSLGLQVIQLEYGQKHLWIALLVVQTLKSSFRRLKYIV